MSNVGFCYVKVLERRVYHFDCRLVLAPCVMSFINSGDASFTDALIYVLVRHDNIPDINGVPTCVF